MKIGFLGLGNMGEPIAGHLLQQGHEVTVWNRTRAKADRLVRAGARAADSIAEAARHDVVFTMVADDHALGEILGGGLLDALPQGGVHVGMSTISVATAQSIAASHEQRQQLYVSAPVFGRPDAATAGKLFMVVAGQSEAVERCQPLFAAFSQRVFVLGADPAMANVAKLTGNFLIAAVIESLGEAIALVRKYGLDPHQYLEFLTSSLFPSSVYQGYGQRIAAEQFTPVGFRIVLGLKDLDLVLRAAESKYVSLPLGSLIRDHLLTSIARYGDDVDWSMLARLLSDDAGLGRR